MILCNFNINNLFIRYKFGSTFPGDQSGKSASENEDYGYLPLYQKGSFEIFNAAQRKLASLALTRGGTVWPDIICLQEVESLIALRTFNEQFLNAAFPYALLIDSRDFRQIDVGILSKYPIMSVHSHIDDKTKEGEYIFNRDCLEATIQLKKGTDVTLFINHFKSKLAQGKTPEARMADIQRANAKRRLQAETVLKIVRERFPGNSFNSENFAILGDFNDTPQAPELASLAGNHGLKDAIESGLPPEERWTHYYKSEGSVSQLDHILLSPSLGRKLKSVQIERRGIGYREHSRRDDSLILPKQVKLKQSDDDSSPPLIDFQFNRFDDVTTENCASDHCPIFAEFDLSTSVLL
ncbi:MAG: endonuclease/exonuclease/phosphatase family protein [Gammaproteobacteria bacterium]|nr:endonuclease/exonuclease/phosphatase family protein [Gammaproteobacteria bacterium]